SGLLREAEATSAVAPQASSDYPWNGLHGWTFHRAQPRTFQTGSVNRGQVRDRQLVGIGREAVAAKLRRSRPQHQMEGRAADVAVVGPQPPPMRRHDRPTNGQPESE